MAKDLDLGLFLATQAKDYNGVKERIENGADVNIKDNNGKNAFDYVNNIADNNYEKGKSKLSLKSRLKLKPNKNLMTLEWECNKNKPKGSIICQ